MRVQVKEHFQYSVLAKPGQQQPRGRKEVGVAVDIFSLQKAPPEEPAIWEAEAG